MATNKECLIIVLDVRVCADEDFKLKSIKCVAEILKDKICGAKKDYVSFVLVGCERTENQMPADANTSSKKEKYANIVEYPQTQITTWQLLLNFFKFVNETPTVQGNWLDALVVAMQMLQSAQENFKCSRQRILLFYDFNDVSQNYDDFDVITKHILESDTELIVACHKIVYIDNAETATPQAVFKSTRKINIDEQMNQKYARRLVSDCNATLCNLKESLNAIFKVSNKRPWCWTSKLTIGSKIIINISGIIAMKDESNIKLKKVWSEADESFSRETQYTIKGSEITPMPEELIDGYMLGGTPVAYDEMIMDKHYTQTPGLKFLGFIKRNAIPDEYYCGDSLYLIVHQKGMSASARKLDALVRALHNTERVILCWKIFSVKFNQPRIVILVPNELEDDTPATLSMIELSYHAQHHFWDFPALRTEKTACTDEQMQAIDKLIDCMDLEYTLKDGQQQRTRRQNDLLPFDELPHIYEQNVMDFLERKILRGAGDDELYQEILSDKNFVEIFWKVPEPIEQKAKKASNQLKTLFPLEKSRTWLEKIKEEKLKMQIKTESNSTDDIDEANTMPMLDYDSVRLATPAEDFQELLSHNVLKLQNTTLRDAKFNKYAKQMRSIIEQLLNVTPNNMELEKIAQALNIYRKRCWDFNTFSDYNNWLLEIKQLALRHNLEKFWQDVMVQRKLGLCVIGEPSLEDDVRIDEYYNWSSGQHNIKASAMDADNDL